MRKAQIFALSFLDGFTFAGFLSKSRLPGAPTRVFASEDSPGALPKLMSAKVQSATLRAKPGAHSKEDFLHHRGTVER